MALDGQAENVSGFVPSVLGVGRQFRSTGLTATPCLYLGLDHHPNPYGGRSTGCFTESCCGPAVQYGHRVTSGEVSRLILVQVQCVSFGPTGRLSHLQHYDKRPRRNNSLQTEP